MFWFTDAIEKTESGGRNDHFRLTRKCCLVLVLLIHRSTRRKKCLILRLCSYFSFSKCMNSNWHRNVKCFFKEALIFFFFHFSHFVAAWNCPPSLALLLQAFYKYFLIIYLYFLLNAVNYYKCLLGSPWNITWLMACRWLIWNHIAILSCLSYS